MIANIVSIIDNASGASKYSDNQLDNKYIFNTNKHIPYPSSAPIVIITNPNNRDNKVIIISP